MTSVDGVFEKLVYWLALAISVFHIFLNYFAFLPENWSGSIHFASFGCLGALIYFKNIYLRSAISCLLIVSSGYLILFEDLLYDRGQTFIFSDYAVSIATIGIALLLVYKVVGWFIPCLILAALTYVAIWGEYVPGIFNFRGLSWESVLFRNYFSPDGMFGSIAQISWTFVFMFVLFGAFLQVSGAGDYLLSISTKLTSRLRGGPGLVAVFASGAMGSVSGSAIANTAATGVMTIPAMKKAGFSREFSAGVEAAASTGGQLMPPIMGAGAFIMASYTQLPYITIITAAFMPAILYYISVAFFVRSYAIKHNISVSAQEKSKASEAKSFKNGWRHLVAIATLVGALIAGFTPMFGVAIAILMIIALSWISEKPMQIKEVADSLVEGARGMVVTAILLVSIGILVNAITTSGVGNTFSLMAVTWSGGSLLVLLFLIAIASLILGAGLPVTASYIIVATLLAPVLSDLIASNFLETFINSGVPLEQMDMVKSLVPGLSDSAVPVRDVLLSLDSSTRQLVFGMLLSPEILMMSLLAAHLIIFWLSQDSNVTPPVCLVAYTAAGIAEASHNKTAFCAWKLAKGLYIVPFLMAYSPLITGDGYERIYSFLFSALGLYCVVCSWEGVVNLNVSKAIRLVLGIVAIVLLFPSDYLLVKTVVSAGLVVYLAWDRILYARGLQHTYEAV